MSNLDATPVSTPGHLMAGEIAEQPQVWRRLLTEGLDPIRSAAGLVSPSTVTVYGARPDLRDVLYIAVSQSGRSPDLVRSVEVARAQGALTVAVTNSPESDLAAAAEIHIDVLAGSERSVAATKSYTAELLALQLLLSGGDRDQPRGLRKVTETL